MTDHPTLAAAAERARARRRPDTLDEVLAGSGLPPEDQEAVQQHADWLLAEQDSPEPEELLPVRALRLAELVLDVDTMRAAAPQVRALLVENVRRSATMLRAARGTVVVPEDTYELVRRLTAAQEVCRQWAQAFTDAAAEAAALIEEEAVTAMGEQDGIPNGSLFVPDGEGQRIAVRADWRPGDSTWDVGSLAAWLAEDTVAEQGVGTQTEDPVFTAQEAVSLVRDGLDRLLALGRYTPGARAVEELRRKLAGQQRDADAAVLRQLRTTGERRYQGVKITREEA